MTLEEMVQFFRRSWELLSPSRDHSLEAVAADAKRINEALAVKVGYSACSISLPERIEFEARTPAENTIGLTLEVIVVTIWKANDCSSLLIVDDGTMLEVRGEVVKTEGRRAS